MAIEPGETATWVGGVCAAIAAFLLKHLHTRITESATKVELTTAIAAIGTRRAEDSIINEEWKRERREVERQLFERLVKQDVILARIDERTGRLARDAD